MVEGDEGAESVVAESEVVRVVEEVEAEEMGLELGEVGEGEGGIVAVGLEVGEDFGGGC